MALLPVVRRHRQAQLGKAIEDTGADADHVDDDCWEVVQPSLTIDVPVGFGDMACGCHGVGLVMGAVQPDPSAFTTHADRLDGPGMPDGVVIGGSCGPNSGAVTDKDIAPPVGIEPTTNRLETDHDQQ